MRESLMYGSVRGARGNSRPHRDIPIFAIDLLHRPEECCWERYGHSGLLGCAPALSCGSSVVGRDVRLARDFICCAHPTRVGQSRMRILVRGGNPPSRLVFGIFAWPTCPDC
jgi:hypothetical protein